MLVKCTLTFVVCMCIVFEGGATALLNRLCVTSQDDNGVYCQCSTCLSQRPGVCASSHYYFRLHIIYYFVRAHCLIILIEKPNRERGRVFITVTCSLLPGRPLAVSLQDESGCVEVTALHAVVKKVLDSLTVFLGLIEVAISLSSYWM